MQPAAQGSEVALDGVHTRIVQAISLMAGGPTVGTPLDGFEAVQLLHSMRTGLGGAPISVSMAALLHLAEFLFHGDAMNDVELANLAAMLARLGCSDAMVQLLAAGVRGEDVLACLDALALRDCPRDCAP